MTVDRIALITGSASGLAVAMARKLASDGFALALNYRESKEPCERLAQELREQYGIEAISIGADMTKPAEIHHLMDEVVSHFGTLHALVHSAGPFLFKRQRLTEYSDAEFDEMIAGNLTSAFHLFRRAIPLMRPQAFGRIVTVGFERVQDAPGWAYRSAYAAAKTGLASLTRTVAQEEWESGITANMICPGDIRGRDKEASAGGGLPGSGLRSPKGGDIAELVSFLLSPRSQHVNANILSVNGFVDVLAGYDRGKAEVFDARVFDIGQTVRVIPLDQSGVIVSRKDRRNRRSLYTVRSGDGEADWICEQLEEDSRGV